MYINKKQIKAYFNSREKRIGEDSLDLIDVKVKMLLDSIIHSTKHFKTVKKEDVSNYSIKLNI